MATSAPEIGTDALPVPSVHPHTRRLLHDPILPTLLRMAWPNILIMLAQASTGLIETWWVSRLGTEALAGMALSFPPVMLMQMMSAGAFGGGISSAISRALGGGRNHDADALVLHAVVINLVLGLFFSVIMLTFGRPIYQALGGEGAELDAALAYSDVVFAGSALLWLLNGLASVIRGTGNMHVPAAVICVGVVLLIPLSPLLIFGFGPFPGLGVAGGGAAVVAFNAIGTAVLSWYILSGRNLARFRLTRLRWSMFREILRIGAIGAIGTIQTNVTIALATALVASQAGVAAVAGFGTGARLEYLLVPLAFGVGAPMVALVGTNIGAGQRERAVQIAFVGAVVTFIMTETVGLLAAVFPSAWLTLFSTDPSAIEAGSTYLRIVGPTYGFFGFGLTLYFASQGAGHVIWPLVSGFIRLLVAAIGGWLALEITGSLGGLFAVLALALVIYGCFLAGAVKARVWFPDRARRAAALT